MSKMVVNVNELISEYLVCKTQNGYNPVITSSEFMDLVTFFADKVQIEGMLDNGNELLIKFFENKEKKDNYKDLLFYVNSTKSTDSVECRPKMILCYDAEKKEYKIKAGNYLLSFEGIKSAEYLKREIDNLVLEFLSNSPKRVIDECAKVSDKQLYIGKCISAKIVNEIWKSYIYYKEESWPKQCWDINKYLLQMDLAAIIDLESIRQNLLDLYCAFSKRIAALYSEDKSLGISTYKNHVLEHQNFLLITNGFERLVSYAYGEYKKSLEINLSKLSIEETYEYGTSYYDEYSDYKTDTTKIGNSFTSELVSNIDKAIRKANRNIKPRRRV